MAAPAAMAASPASSAPAGSAPAQGRRGRGPADGPPAPWDRPADGPALVTEDFESGALDDKKWAMHVHGDETITVEQDTVAHGKNALHIHDPMGASGAYAFVGLTIPDSLKDHFYGRAYVLLKGVPAGHSVLMLAGSTGFPLADFLEIGTDRGKFQPSFQLNKPTTERPRGETTHQVGTLPVDRWFCLEWEFMDQPDRIVMWVDGKLAVNQPLTYSIIKGTPATSSGLTGGFFEYNLGFRAWGRALANDVDVYYDDIAISDKPIGQLTPVPAPAMAAATPAAPADSSAAK
jgi:hypothetical protein